MSITAQQPADHELASGYGTHPSSGSDALLAALVYADLFDCPLSLDELHRFQVGTRLGRDEVREIVVNGAISKEAHSQESGLYALRGREQTVRLRIHRTARSRRLWPRARAYGRIASLLPFVRLVAVTGALAVNNVGERPDIDFLVVAAAGRVWICRRALIFLVRCARILGDDLCPNYVISEDDLTLDQRDFFTAHELAQMVPLAGREQYRRMIESNAWAAEYLPCAFTHRHAPVASRRSVVKSLLERLLCLRVFDPWEAWELARMRKQLRPLLGTAAEVICSASQCKGHTGLHRQSVLTRFVSALESRGLTEPLRIVEQPICVNRP